MMDNAAFIEGWYKCNWPISSLNGFSGFFTGRYYYFHDGRTTTKVDGRWPEKKTWPPEEFPALTENSELSKYMLASYYLERVEFPFKTADRVYVRRDNTTIEYSGIIKGYDVYTGRYNVKFDNAKPWFNHWCYPWELSYSEKQKEEERPMGDLINGWYKCTESNEKYGDGNWSWIEGRYYYFKNGRTEDERGFQRPAGTFPLYRGSDGDLWLACCFLIPAEWSNGCPVQLKDGRTGRITICKDEMIGVQLDSAYNIPSFVQVTPNDFEVITPEAQAFKIPEVGMHVRDKKTLKVYRVEEVELTKCCDDANPYHGGYAELQLMTTTPTHKPYPCCNNVLFAINAKLMCHDPDLEHFWDNYEEYEDRGWSGMYFDRGCNCGRGKIITVCNGQIAPGSYDDGRRFKSFEEIKSHIPNIIEVDSMTYHEQDDPMEGFFTGYALCVENTEKVYYHNTPYKTSTISGLTVGKIYRMTAGHYIDDNGDLNDCDPNEFSKHFVEVHGLE